MPRFPIKKTDISDNKALISGDDFKHITKVLRLKEGNSIILFDDDSYEHLSVITEINKRELTAEIKSSKHVNRESNLQLNLFQCIPNKISTFELILQKATELGVKNIIPVISERTQNKSNYNKKRWDKIVVESSKQCNRNSQPIITEPVIFNDSFGVDMESDLKIIFYVGSEKPLKSYIKSVSKEADSINLYIGPEGGFTTDEIEIARNNHYTDVGLGSRILRAETAAISAITLLQFYFGDL